jgi:hypothetical protein
MEMNKNVKGAIIVLVVAIIAYVIYKFAFKGSVERNMQKGYAKKKGEWVAGDVSEYDKDWYSGTNTAGVTVYFKKSDVKTRKGANKGDEGTYADAIRDMNVYTLKS